MATDGYGKSIAIRSYHLYLCNASIWKGRNGILPSQTWKPCHCAAVLCVVAEYVSVLLLAGCAQSTQSAGPKVTLLFPGYLLLSHAQ